jgi:tRNA (guanine-N7-)-methyltransferase
MRLRHVRGGRAFLEAHPNHIILDPATHQGRWRSLFGNERPLHLEIGMGKGQFVMGMARRNPEVNFIGLERVSLPTRLFSLEIGG